jgi:predicted nucleotidyltransferase
MAQPCMLQNRIIFTIKFFDLQETPLTLIELHEYLFDAEENIRGKINNQWEVQGENGGSEKVSLDAVLRCLDQECKNEIGSDKGFYFLKGRHGLVAKRLDNYLFGIARERLINHYAWFFKYIPFVRGVALAGSQALGLQKQNSDIDLFIVTDPEFLWLTRTLVTGYLQITGKRRHGKLIANRFCLNHYIAAPKEVQEYKNAYTASEYIKLRPLAYASVIYRFQYHNKGWINQLFPNAEFLKVPEEKQLADQKLLEKLFTNRFGYWLERKLKNWQLPKIRTQEKFIVVKDDELSFHPQSKQQELLAEFFK